MQFIHACTPYQSRPIRFTLRCTNSLKLAQLGDEITHNIVVGTTPRHQRRRDFDAEGVEAAPKARSRGAEG